MRYTMAFLSAVFFLATTSFAQSRIAVEDLAHHPFEADFSAGGQIDLHIRSAEIHIIGSDENKIGVRVGGKQGSNSTDMKARFARSDNSCELRITGGPHNELTITVQVPKNSNLFVRIFAGDVEVNGITGNKDIELHAGDLTIGVGDAADYAHVKASVSSGEINAKPRIVPIFREVRQWQIQASSARRRRRPDSEVGQRLRIARHPDSSSHRVT